MEGYIRSPEFAQQLGYSFNYDFNHFHNQLLDELVQFGIIGAIPLLAMFAYICFIAVRKRDILLLSFLLIYIPFCNVESPFSSVKGIMGFLFWLCFILSAQKVSANVSPTIQS